VIPFVDSTVLIFHQGLGDMIDSTFLIFHQGPRDMENQKSSVNRNYSIFFSIVIFRTAGSGGALWVQRDSPDFRVHTHLWARTDLFLSRSSPLRHSITQYEQTNNSGLTNQNPITAHEPVCVPDVLVIDLGAKCLD